MPRGLCTNESAAREREDYRHWLLEHLTAKALSSGHATILTNEEVDMLAVLQSEGILFEMKSCTQTSVICQARTGIMQLLEYQYVYRTELPRNTRLCLVLERRPTGKSGWLLEYADSLRVGVIWKASRDQLHCSRQAYTALEKLNCHANFKLGE
jgi:hypothetical protein